MCNRKSEEDPAFMAQMFNDDRRQREGSIIQFLLHFHFLPKRE